MTGLTWSGSATTVSNGQSATGLVIRLFDTLLVEHGGTVTDSQVTGAGLGIQGGTVDEDPPGSALVFGLISNTEIGGDVVSNGTTYTGGGAIVNLQSGALALDTTIELAGGTLYVGNDAIAKGVTNAGAVVISAGGKAYNITDNGDERVDGGTVSNTTINYGAFGGSQEITSGGVAVATTLKGSDSVQTITGGTASDTTLTGSGSQQQVSSGGVAIDTTLGKDTFSFVSAGGATTSTTVEKGAIQVVLGGGSAVDTTVDAGGILLNLGGTIAGDVVSPGGTLIDSGVVILQGSVVVTYPSGSTPVETLNIDGKVIKFYPHTASGVTVGTNEVAFVLQGGRALSMTDDTYMAIGSGGYASGTTVGSLAALLVDGGGVASSTQVTANVSQDADDVGSVTVLSGGKATSTTINTAAMTVSSGGAANATTLAGSTYTSMASGGGGGPAPAYGELFVLSHGVASGVTLDNLGVLQDYGIVGGIIVNSGGVAVVEHGAKTTGTQVSEGGAEVVYGVASATVLSTYAKDTIEVGGVAIATDIVNYSFMYVSGHGSGIQDVGGGEISAFSGAFVTGSTIDNGGELEIYGGAIASGTYLSGGGIVVFGKAYGTLTNGEGGIDVESGGVSTDDVLSKSDIEYLFTSGIASNTTVGGGATAGGELAVEGGSSFGAQIRSGGQENVDPGVAISTNVSSGGVLAVYGPGGSAVGATVGDGGYVSVTDSGSFISGTIEGGGKLYLIDGAVASALTVLGGGLAIVDEGNGVPQGLLHSATIASGGTLEVLSANEFASLTNVTVLNGGILAAGGIVVAAGQVASTPGVQTAASNFNGILVKAGGIIDYVNAVVSSGGTLEVTKGAAAITPDVKSAGTIVISSGGSVINGNFEGGANVTDNGTIVVDAAPGGGQATLYTPISGTGGIVFSGSGLLVIEPANSFTGGLTLGSGGTLDLTTSAGAGTGPIDMGGAPVGGATITLGYEAPAPSFANEITGFGLGDAIVLDGVGYAAGYSVVVHGNAVTLDLPATSYTFDIAGASADTIVPAEAPGNVTMLSAIAPSPPPMAAFLAQPGASVVPAGPHTLAQAISASEAFQAHADSASLFGSEGLGGPAAAPVSVHCGAMLTDLHAGGTATPFPAAPISAA